MLREKITECVREGDFILSSGKFSHYYIDVVGLTADPEALAEITSRLAALVGKIKPDYLAAERESGFYLACMLSEKTSIPLITVRLPFGVYLPTIRKGGGKRGKVVVIDDIMITGYKTLKVCDFLKKEGYAIAGVLALVALNETPRELKALNVLSPFTIRVGEGRPVIEEASNGG